MKLSPLATLICIGAVSIGCTEPASDKQNSNDLPPALDAGLIDPTAEGGEPEKINVSQPLAGEPNVEAQVEGETSDPQADAPGTDAQGTGAPETDTPPAATATDVPFDPNAPQVPLNVNLSEGEVFARVEGCLSGFFYDITDQSQSVNLQKTDQNCIFRLISVRIDGELFNMEAVSNWSEGTQFITTGDNGSTMTVSIIKTLRPVIGDSEAVVIAFSKAKEFPTINYRPQSPLEVTLTTNPGLPVTLEDFDVSVAESGAGRFDLRFNCNATTEEGLARCLQSVQEEGVNVALTSIPEGFVPSYEACNTLVQSSSRTLVIEETSIRSVVDGPVRLFDQQNERLVMSVGSREYGRSCEFYFFNINRQ